MEETGYGNQQKSADEKDKIKNCYLETRHRGPIAIALYIKILTWLRGFTDKMANFSRLDLTRHSQRRLEQKETQTKHRNTTKELRSHVRILIYRTGFQRDNLIGHFRVPKTLTSKMRPSVQPFLWKLVLFAWEWKMISISKAEPLTSFWNRGPGELGNGLFAIILE